MTSLRPISEITITQQGAGRSLTLFFDFVNEFNATDTWVDLTNQAAIRLPKKLNAINQNGKKFPLDGTNVNIGGFDSIKPLFLKGDKVEIVMGYRYNDDGVETINKSTIFKGYITEILSKKPFELKCEDNMWLLKQIPAKPQVWKGSVESLFANLLSGYPQFTVNQTTTTTIGSFIIGNESVAQLLERLRREAHIEAYFRGDELRVGGLVYLESDNVDTTGKAIYKKFVFQENIINDELYYKRKDDNILSAIVISKYEDFTGSAAKDGSAKTKKQQLEILVYWDKNKKNADGTTGQWDYIKKVRGQELPPNVEGERRTFNYINITDENILFQKGIESLQKYFYTGFKGKFTTFGIPYVRQGDNVIIEDQILPERNGKYKVKGVEYTGGVNGQRQTIMLDYLIP
jgi:hypothetical protein